jgi:hypothetical protein
VALILTLRDGGARLVSTGNLNTTQPDALQALAAEGVTVIGGPAKNSQVHGRYLDQLIAARPDLILDNGGDLFAKYLDAPGPRPLGNSIESMDLGFALQARCLAVATGSVDAGSCVVPVPARIGAAVASSYLDRKYPAAPAL